MTFLGLGGDAGAHLAWRAMAAMASTLSTGRSKRTSVSTPRIDSPKLRTRAAGGGTGLPHRGVAERLLQMRSWERRRMALQRDIKALRRPTSPSARRGSRSGPRRDETTIAAPKGAALIEVDPAGTAPASESASESASPSAVDGESLAGVVTIDEPTPRQTSCDLTRRPDAGADGPGPLADTGDPPHDPKGGRWLSVLRVRQRERASEKTPQLRWFPVFDAVLRVRGSLTDSVPPRRNWFGPVRSG